MEYCSSEKFQEIYDDLVPDLDLPRLNELPDLEKKVALYFYLTDQQEPIDRIKQALYCRKVPTIEEWLTDRKYFGKEAKTWYPYWIDMVKRFFQPNSPLNYCIYEGSIGIGKSTIARGCCFYALYRALCLRDPHAVFSLTKDTPISMLLISLSLTQVDETQLQPFKTMLSMCDQFVKVKSDELLLMPINPDDPIPYKESSENIKFPNNISIIVGSQFQHSVGRAILISLWDEANEASGGKAEKAFGLLGSIKERIRTRFAGSNLTYMALVSSAKVKDAIVSQHISEIPLDDRNTLVLRPKQWEVRGSSFYVDPRTFPVFVGNSIIPHKVLSEQEYEEYLIKPDTMPEHCELLRVPMLYFNDFKGRINEAIQNIAGIATDTSNKPFNNLKTLKHSRLCPELTLWDDYNSDTPLFNQIPKTYFRETPKGLRLKRYPEVKRYGHLDLAVAKGSYAGLAICHKELYQDPETKARKVMFVYDFVIGITTKNRIRIQHVEDLIRDLEEKAGINLARISCDQFQSRFLQERWEKMGIADSVEYQSVVTKADAYLQAASFISEGLVKTGDCPILRKELLSLCIENNKPRSRDKTDHSDAFVGSLNLAATDLKNQPSVQYLHDDISEDEHLESERAKIMEGYEEVS